MTVEELVKLVSEAPSSRDLGKKEAISESAGLAPSTGPGVQPDDFNGVGGRSRLSEQMVVLAQQVELLRGVQQAQADATTSNTRALVESTAARVVSGVTTAARGALGILGGGASASWIPSVLRLFGGETEQPQPLSKFVRPDPIRVDARSRREGEDPQANDALRLPSINVNVQTLDSRSFLEHSNEIATALKRALLDAHSVHDVLGDL